MALPMEGDKALLPADYGLRAITFGVAMSESSSEHGWGQPPTAQCSSPFPSLFRIILFLLIALLPAAIELSRAMVMRHGWQISELMGSAGSLFYD